MEDFMKNAKEKINKKITIVIQPSLFKDFEEKCKKEYKTVSIKIRELIWEYLNDR